VSADWVRDLMSDRVELRTNKVGDLLRGRARDGL